MHVRGIIASAALLGGLLVGLNPAPASAASVTIDFDALADGTIVTNQYPEATFSSVGTAVNKVTTQIAYNGSPPNFLCTAPTAGSTITCAQETNVNFTTPVSTLTFQGLGINNSSGTVATVGVYQSNVLTQTLSITGASEGLNPKLVDLSAYSNITRIRIYNIVDGGGIGWDTFSFNNSAGDACPANATITGTAGNDTINGTSGNDIICGLGGNDIIYGYSGRDRIIGGAGDDTIYGGSGNDSLISREGNDTIDGGSGDDRIEVDDGASGDTANGSSGTDKCFTDAGDTRTSCEA